MTSLWLYTHLVAGGALLQIIILSLPERVKSDRVTPRDSSNGRPRRPNRTGCVSEPVPRTAGLLTIL
jgi:hypothetical protein